MKLITRVQWALLAATFVLTPRIAEATTGYFQNGLGPVNKALAGAGIACEMCTTTYATNPALLVEAGNRIDLAGSAFVPLREFSAEGPGFVPTGTTESENNFFFIPAGGFNYMVHEDHAVGISLLANGGLNTTYPNVDGTMRCPPPPNSAGGGVFCGGESGVDVQQLLIVPNYSVRLLDGELTFGISPVIAIQLFEARGLAAFGANSQDPTKLTDNGYSVQVGGGFRLGFKLRPNEMVSLGAAYHSRVWGTGFSDYAGLFAEEGNFDVPESVTAGFQFTPLEYFSLLLEYQFIAFNSVRSIGNKQFEGGPLGADNGSGFGWENVHVFRFAAMSPVADWLTLRAGYSFNTNPIQESEVLFNILAPGVIEHHIGFGAGFTFAEHWVVDLSGQINPTTSITGTGTPNPQAVPAQQITLQMWQFDIGLGLAYRW